MILKWLQSPQPFESNLSEFNTIQKSQKKNSRNSCIRWVNSPTSIRELLCTEDFISYISTNLIFFHNKSPSCMELITNKLKDITRNLEVIELTTSNIDIDNFLNRINSPEKNILHIITIDDKSKFDEFVVLSDLLFLSNGVGIWIKGYIEDILSYIPFLFAGMFIFDTSKQELDIIKQRISISDNTIHLLKKNQNDFFSKESVLFYWNYEKNNKAPALFINPILLGMGKKLNYLEQANIIKKTNEFNYFISGDVNVDNYTVNGQAGAVGKKATSNNNTFHQQVNSQLNDLKYTTDDINSIKLLVDKLRLDPPKDIEENITYEAMAKLAKITKSNDQIENQKIAIAEWQDWFSNLPEATTTALTVASGVVTLTPVAKTVIGTYWHMIMLVITS